MRGIPYNFKHIKPRRTSEEERYWHRWQRIFENPVPIYAFYERKNLRELINVDNMKIRLKTWHN